MEPVKGCVVVFTEIASKDIPAVLEAIDKIRFDRASASAASVSAEQLRFAALEQTALNEEVLRSEIRSICDVLPEGPGLLPERVARLVRELETLRGETPLHGPTIDACVEACNSVLRSYGGEVDPSVNEGAQAVAVCVHRIRELDSRGAGQGAGVSLADRVAVALQRSKKKKFAVEEEAELPKGYMTRILNGERKNLGPEIMQRLASALGVSVEWLHQGKT